MIPLETLRELFNYNYWARDRQLEACRSLEPEQFLRPLGSSHPSLRDTLAHLYGVEWLYFERFHGRSPRALPAAVEFPTLAELEQRWREIELRLRDYLDRVHDPALANPVTYTNMKGQTISLPLWRVLYHLLNHQSYHRGQVTTLLRQLGAQPVAVDYYVYLLRSLG